MGCRLLQGLIGGGWGIAGRVCLVGRPSLRSRLLRSLAAVLSVIGRGIRRRRLRGLTLERGLDWCAQQIHHLVERRFPGIPRRVHRRLGLGGVLSRAGLVAGGCLRYRLGVTGTHLIRHRSRSLVAGRSCLRCCHHVAARRDGRWCLARLWDRLDGSVLHNSSPFVKLLKCDIDRVLNLIAGPQPSVSPVIADGEFASFPPQGEQIESMHPAIHSPF